MGFANFNRTFIKDFSRKAMPLTKLTRGDQRFEWEAAQQGAFEEIKQACMKAPILRIYDSSRESRMETDASDQAIGTRFSQRYSDE